MNGDPAVARMVVFSNARPGREDEFNDWYDDVHVPDVLGRLEGYIGVRRYEAGGACGLNEAWRYLAVWDVDPAVGLTRAVASVRWLREAKRAGSYAPGDTLYTGNPGMHTCSSGWYVVAERASHGGMYVDARRLVVVTGARPLRLHDRGERLVLGPSQLEREPFRFLDMYPGDSPAGAGGIPEWAHRGDLDSRQQVWQFDLLTSHRP